MVKVKIRKEEGNYTTYLCIVVCDKILNGSDIVSIGNVIKDVA